MELELSAITDDESSGNEVSRMPDANFEPA
jgi:hypothetical protein